jgi:hypothetical protein
VPLDQNVAPDGAKAAKSRAGSVEKRVELLADLEEQTQGKIFKHKLKPV